jgi:two-component system phosphate regulon sensor histidine kinase PhoR
MKLKLILRFVGFALLCTCLLCGIWVGIFFLTAPLYRAWGNALPAFVAQVLNALLGEVIFVLSFIGFMAWMASRPDIKQRRTGVFEQIIEAMRRIAQGDFQVRLAPEVESNALTSELAKSVNQMAEGLYQMEHMRQEFISNVSHEIQSPLSAIRGFAQALHDEELSREKRLHYLDIIETESSRLSRMTENMLKLASLEAEQTPVQRKPYRLDKQIRSLLLAYERLWMEKQIELNVELEEIMVCADEDLLNQVWGNLLHNSLKFTPEHGSINVRACYEGNRIVCCIEDSGIGIAEEVQARIFERFYKVDAARERAQGGNGLGLAIVRKVVELHDGTIEVKSQPGVGTCMTVVLPGIRDV